jgi:opacity protein-like surface antigen
MSSRLIGVVILALAAVAIVPAGAAAQAIGLGPRLSFVRGDVPSAAGSTRFFGGILRMQSSKRVVLEAAVDYRTERSEDGLSRVKERPLQGSLLLFPARSTFAPYVLAGYGLYSRTTETLDLTGVPTAAVSERKTGAHLGFGAELFLGRHAAFVLDYRYRFVRFGSPEGAETPVNLPGLGSRLSHQGSMWTSGVAFYF